MGAALILSATSLTVAAGGDVQFTATVKNTGAVVDEMTFQVLGPLAPYTRITPERLPLYPGSEEDITVTVAPPAGATVPAGTYDFGLRVSSKEFPADSAVDELTIEVLPFSQGGIDLSPRNKTGRRSATYGLAFDNYANAPAVASWRGIQVDNGLSFAFKPQRLDVPPGSAMFSSLDVKPVQTFWKGPTRQVPFAVEATTESGQKYRADGVFLQAALIPRWSWRALGLVALGALGLWAFAAFVARPVIQSEAKEAAVKEVAPVNDDLVATRQAVAQSAADAAQTGGGDGGAARTVNIAAGTVNIAPAAGAPAAAAPAAGGGGGDAPAADSPAAAAAPAAAAPAAAAATTAPPAAVAPVDVFSRRFAPSAAPGATAAQEATVDTATLSVTDVFLQNPLNDAGILRVKRNDAVLLETNLANFRDLDYHFVTGVPFNANEKLIVEVECRNTDRACRPSVYASGEKGGAGRGQNVFSRRLVAAAPANGTASDDAVVDSATLSVTDVFLQNPFDDAGLVRVKRNDTVLLEANLANFRNLGYQFVTGTRFNANEKLTAEVECRNTDRACGASVYIMGQKGAAGQGPDVFSRRFVPSAAAGASAAEEETVRGGTSLTVTDLFLQNPFEDLGVIRVKQNGTVLFENNLANFRDLDYHFVTGMPFNANEKLTVEVECRNTDRACRPSVYVVGQRAKAS